MMARSFALLAAAGCALHATAAVAQSLEDTFATLFRGGFISQAARREPGLLLTADEARLEFRVIDAADCVVRVTTQRPPEPIKDYFSDQVIHVPRPAYQEFYLNRVVASEIRKAPGLDPSRPEENWLLPGNKGDQLRCWVTPPDGRTCYDQIKFGRGIESPDATARGERVDAALSYLYAKLCKGTGRHSPS